MSNSTDQNFLDRAKMNIPEASPARNAMIESIDTEIGPSLVNYEQN